MRRMALTMFALAMLGGCGDSGSRPRASELRDAACRGGRAVCRAIETACTVTGAGATSDGEAR